MFVSTSILTPKEYPKYAEHLKRLPKEDRYCRFRSLMSDESIDKYVAKIQKKSKEIVFAHYNDTLSIDAALQLSLIEPQIQGTQNKIAELSISVLPESRRNGMADALIERSILHARTLSVNRLVTSCSPTNRAMIHLAQRNGMKVTGNYEEKSAELSLGKAELGMITLDLWLQQAGKYDLMSKKTVDAVSKNWEVQKAIFHFMKRVSVLLCPPVQMII